MLACLVKISPVNVSTGTRVSVYASSSDDPALLGLGGFVWEPAVVTPPILGMSLWNGDFSNSLSAAAATIPINMAVLTQTYTGASDYFWNGAPIEIYAQEPGTSWPWAAEFVGKVTSFSRRGNTLSLTAEVDSEPFQAKVLANVYAGTGGAEGPAGLKDKPKPLALGWALNVEPVLIDSVNSVYQFSGYGAIEGVTTLFERGSSFDAAVADYATYAALVAATIQRGRWGTCLAQGMIRLGAPAAGVITGDIKGHRVGLTTPRLTGQIIQALATVAGISSSLLDTAALNAMDTAVPYPMNIVVSDQTTFMELAEVLALNCNSQSGVSLAGKFVATRISFAAGESLTINAQGQAYPQVISSEEAVVSVPYWKTTLGANRSWRVHTTDEIAFAAQIVPRGRYSSSQWYREGDVVSATDGSEWLYIATVSTTGNAPPTWPTTSNTWWQNTRPPTVASDITYVSGATLESLKPASAGATRNEDTANMLESPLLMDTGFEIAATTAREFSNTSAGPGRDRYRIRLDTNNATYAIQSKMIPVSAGEKVWLRAWMFASAGTTGTSQFGVECFNTAQGYVSAVAGPENPASAGANWFLREAQITLPAGVSYIRPYFNRYGGSGGNYFIAEPAITRHQLGADVTLSNTSAGITGQGDLATSNRATLPFGANLAVNSEFLLVDPTYGSGVIPVGWQAGWTGNSTNLGSVTFNDRRVQFQDGSYAFARDVTGAPNGTAMDCVSSYPAAGLPLFRFAVPVLPGERVVASALIGHQNCTGAYAVIGFYDENGAYVDEYAGSTNAANIGAGAYTTITRSALALTGHQVTVPADGGGSGTGKRRWAVIWVRFNISGSPTNPRLLVAAPLIAKVPANQTALPAYSPGPADRQASYGATTGTSLVSPTYGTLSDSGVYTPIGTAAAITGQAATATNSDYTAVTGTKPPADADKTSANTSANTSNVGTVPSTAVQSTINTGGGVANNQVVTASIVNNAVTQPAIAYNSANQTYTSAADQDQQSVTIAAVGGATSVITIFVNIENTTTNGLGSFYTLKVFRGGTLLESGSYQLVATSFTSQTMIFTDTSYSAGNNTYTVKTVGIGSGTFTGRKRFLMVQETKK